MRGPPATGGDWRARYGAKLPLQSAAPRWAWATATADPRALVVEARAAECLYTQGGPIEATVTPPGPGTLGLYFVDWDTAGRAQVVEILDPATRAVLDTRTVERFAGGRWLNWQVTGPVVVRLTRTAGANAVISGAYFAQPAQA